MPWERDVPMARLTRYRIGGPAPRFAEAADREELRRLLRDLDGAPHRVIGGGANLLVADRGVEEAVIRLGDGFAELRLEADHIVAGAAATMPALAGLARRNAVRGYVFLEAVPGTVGGGLSMNAGTTEDWLWDRVEWAEAMTPEGEVVRLTPEEAEPRYRGTGVSPDWIFVEARLTAERGDPEEIERRHEEFRARKVEAQVYDLRSVGSIWKNPGPPHGAAWEVVDRVGMRGARRGGARVSEKHANFIVNLGDARAEDVLGLMAETRRRAREELGIELEPEIQLWGFDAGERAAVGAEG